MTCFESIGKAAGEGQRSPVNFSGGKASAKSHPRVVPKRPRRDELPYVSYQSFTGRDVNSQPLPVLVPAGKVVFPKAQQAVAMGTNSTRSWRGQKVRIQRDPRDLGRAPASSAPHPFFSRDIIVLPLLLTRVADYIYDFSKTS